MKTSMKRKSPKNRWHSQATSARRDDRGDDVVPVDLNAVRNDEEGLAVGPIDGPFQERDAIDRLLDNSGFDDLVPVKGQAAELNALDDFEPHFDTAFTVASLDTDPHLQVQPLPEYEVESSQDLTFSAKADDAEVEPIPLAVVNETADAKDLFVDTEWFAEPFSEDALQSADETSVFDGDVDVDVDESRAVEQADGRIEPVIETQGLDAADIQPITESFFVEPEAADFSARNTFDDSRPDTGTEHYSVQEKVLSARQTAQQLVPEASQPALPVNRREHSTRPSKLNVFLLVLSLVSSLVTLILFFLLMDMREDLVKLNEMLDIMKDDIQMLREDAPAEQ